MSWYETTPEQSLKLITAAELSADSPIVDVGAGASRLVDQLQAAGYQDLTAVDVTPAGLAVSRARLGDRAESVAWITADVRDWEPQRRYQLWHDRAVFHFLTGEDDRRRYRQVLRAALAPGGRVVIGTFAADGPVQCSGLPTARYDAAELAAQFPGFTVLRQLRTEHWTPNGQVQPFTWLLLADAA